MEREDFDRLASRGQALLDLAERGEPVTPEALAEELAATAKRFISPCTRRLSLVEASIGVFLAGIAENLRPLPPINERPAVTAGAGA